MVEEDERSMLMRQALNELEVTYDAVGAFSVTVDAHKAIKDVTQVFYEEDRQVLLTEVEKGFEDDEGLHRTRGVGSGLDNGDEARDRVPEHDDEHGLAACSVAHAEVRRGHQLHLRSQLAVFTEAPVAPVLAATDAAHCGCRAGVVARGQRRVARRRNRRVGREAAEQRHEQLLDQPLRLAARDLQQQQDRKRKSRRWWRGGLRLAWHGIGGPGPYRQLQTHVGGQAGGPCWREAVRLLCRRAQRRLSQKVEDAEQRRGD